MDDPAREAHHEIEYFFATTSGAFRNTTFVVTGFLLYLVTLDQRNAEFRRVGDLF